MKKVFIDGSSGTVGLKLLERLNTRADIELLSLPLSQRHNAAAREKVINAADIVFLCLPDEAAKAAVEMRRNATTVFIDASTAHRTEISWAYGFPELGMNFYDRIESSRQITVPGCHASGFIALIYPLVKAGLLPADIKLSCFSLTGYSGGGKNMIAEYEAQPHNKLLDAPRQYALSQQHKHLKEMQIICSLEKAPVFCPVVGAFYSGMEVTVPIFASDLLQNADMQQLKELYQSYYVKGMVHFEEQMTEAGFLSAASLAGKDNMQITVEGNDERMLLIARYDNLGKGAAGAAVECMNIVLGKAAETSLIF